MSVDGFLGIFFLTSRLVYSPSFGLNALIGTKCEDNNRYEGGGYCFRG